jgi:4-amino-4-deoxy-L-arabinose transferase-like glycosyltransferase
VELRHVHAVCLAGAVKMTRNAGLAVTALLILRAAMAAWLPLSADEAYYWLWSKHLAAGYYDHPPLIAFVIRLGTFLFGDSEFGVRFGGVILSALASWFVWRAAAAILRDESRAALAVLLFNLTLMIGAEMLAVTPDTPSIAATAAFLFCLARVQGTQDGRWWLWAGVAAGLGLLSKYSGFFVGAGGLVWLLASAKARPWLKTIWPWAGGVLAGLIFLPNLWWQSQHQWMTFVFQFGRVTGGHLTARFLVEFVGAQLGLATPFIFVLAVLGAWQARSRDDNRFLLLALLAPAMVYFAIHTLHDRVQGNWPSFLYPMLAVLAADAFTLDPGRWYSRFAMPVAAAILLLAYLQAATGLIALKQDPLARLLGVGMGDVAGKVAALKQQSGARAVLTGDYETTAWLRFYGPSLPLIAVDQPNRYLDAPAAVIESGPLLYFADQARGRNAALIGNFGSQAELMEIPRQRRGHFIARYEIWRLDAPKSAIQGRMP